MYRHFFKRFFDITAGLLLLMIFLPLLGFIAVVVKLTSPGPVFFRQQRGGLNGRYFSIFKFRTMSAAPASDGKDFHPGNDSRVTAAGVFLRKTKLDELPQLLNVIKGDMSLVGPRPEVKTYIELYPERWRKVLSVRPGITDPASLTFRNEEELLASLPDYPD